MERSEVYYNYILDVYPDWDGGNSTESEIDSRSGRLNRALYDAYFSDARRQRFGIGRAELKAQPDRYHGGVFYSIFVDEPKCILSTDYIGPSKYQSGVIAGWSDDEVHAMLRASRTLGGHLVWPRGTGRGTSINMTRGGEIRRGCGYGFYDRIDWTLLVLEAFYHYIDADAAEAQYLDWVNARLPEGELGANDKKCVFALLAAFAHSREWFRAFGSFENFCVFFRLLGSFTAADGRTLPLTDYLPIRPTAEGYGEYIRNNLQAIERRNRLLLAD